MGELPPETNVRREARLLVAMTDGLDYLEHFQYECTEQTISRFLPNVLTTLALREAGLSNPDLEANLAAQVEVALQRLYSRQRSDGGWPWWDQGPSDPIVSAYVLLGLVEARNAGYTVSEGVISNGRSFLRNNWRSAGLEAGRSRFNRQAFILYVLALADSDVSIFIDQLYETRASLDIYGRAFLAQAIYLIDDGDPRLETMAADFVSDAILSATGAHWEEESPDYWNWNTDTRTTAIVLSAMAKIDPDNPLVANTTRWLMAHRTDGRWQGTQETAWVLMGLTEKGAVRFLYLIGVVSGFSAIFVSRNDSLTSPVNWTTVTNEITLDGNLNRVTLTPTQNAGFFRLAQ